MGRRVREESRLTQGYCCHFQKWEKLGLAENPQGITSKLGLGVEIPSLNLGVLSSRWLLGIPMGVLSR